MYGASSRPCRIAHLQKICQPMPAVRYSPLDPEAQPFTRSSDSMGALLEIVTPLHKRTTRDYAGRMADDKVHCMAIAKQYGQDYWDGDRRYGYGGYRYDGRWGVVAERLIEHYRLPANARILDVGCGKGFLLHELMLRLPDAHVAGFDISTYALDHAKPEVQAALFE